MVGPEVDGDESRPHDARAVHCESDVLGLVKVLRNFARLESVHRAQDDEKHVVEERHHGGHLTGPTLHGQVILLVQAVLCGRLLEAQPRQPPDHLHGHEAGADEDLRARGRVAGPLDHGFDADVEDAVDAVGLGQQRRVDEAERDADAEAPDGAQDRRGSDEHDEGRGVGHEDAEQQQVAQLATRGHDDWSAVVADEDDQDEDGGDHAEDAEGSWKQEPRAAELDVDLRQPHAPCTVGVGLGLVVTRLARLLVLIGRH